ncbi:PREDICTED: E3 ubiquitin-protein ligase SINA-like 2 [Camelina sativa]|uniref:RING-type E3 ubiquitin transferase n=1 Tax=Camelina sativa TaxID=90675 RepID=A0ABM1R8I6_CAMSA|nr:PREDICTED: E3 ubiquitin-protein ligase SINA-like 2 [Camelina sativa]
MGGGDGKVATIHELDLFNCPICSEALTSPMPIFQCENGHIACSSCCTKVKNKCPACTLPINYRSKIVERLVKAIIMPCPNAKLGCTETFSYGKELVHEKTCRFAPK